MNFVNSNNHDLLRMKGKCVQVISAHTGDLAACAFSNDNTLATASRDKTVRLWTYNLVEDKWEENACSPLEGHAYALTACCFSTVTSSDLLNSMLATAAADGHIYIWNAETGDKLMSLQHESGASIRCCQFCRNDACLVSGADDGSMFIWDLRSNQCKKKLEGHEDSVNACDWSPDSQWIVSGSSAGDLKVWDAAFSHALPLCTVRDAHDLGVTALHFRPKGPRQSSTRAQMLATGGTDYLVTLWYLQTTGGKIDLVKHKQLEGHSGAVMCVQFHPDSMLLGSAGGDKCIRLWTVAGERVMVLDGHSRFVTGFAFSPAGAMIASGSNDKTVRIWYLTSELENEDAIKEADISFKCEDERSNLIRLFTPPLVSTAIPPPEWGEPEVSRWLENIGMESLLGAARQIHLDGKKLLCLTEEKETMELLSCDDEEAIMKLLKKIRQLRRRDDATPPEFCCPITHSKMSNPVVAEDGYSYEKAAIEEWLARGKDNSPMTNERLQSTLLLPNHTLRALITRHYEDNKQ